MKITNVSVVPGWGVQVCTIQKAHRKQSTCNITFGGPSFTRHKIIARKLLLPLIGMYNLISVDQHVINGLLESQYSWRRNDPR